MYLCSVSAKCFGVAMEDFMSSWGPHTIYIQASFIFIPSTDTYIHIYLITLPQNYVRNVLGRN